MPMVSGVLLQDNTEIGSPLSLVGFTTGQPVIGATIALGERVPQTSNYQCQPTDNFVLMDTSNQALVCTLCAQDLMVSPWICIKNVGKNNVTINTADNALIDGAASINVQGGAATMHAFLIGYQNGNYWIMGAY